jgi:hypothetical protein
MMQRTLGSAKRALVLVFLLVTMVGDAALGAPASEQRAPAPESPVAAAPMPR